MLMEFYNNPSANQVIRRLYNHLEYTDFASVRDAEDFGHMWWHLITTAHTKLCHSSTGSVPLKSSSSTWYTNTFTWFCNPAPLAHALSGSIGGVSSPPPTSSSATHPPEVSPQNPPPPLGTPTPLHATVIPHSPHPAPLVTKRRPDRLDLLVVKNFPSPLPLALTTARIIDDLGSVPYPEGIKSPRMELNVNGKDGKFRYDPDFLLQFMSVCKEKPDNLSQRKRLVLQPQTKPESDLVSRQEWDLDKDDNEASEEPGQEMLEAEAKKKIAEDTKEFFGVQIWERPKYTLPRLLRIKLGAVLKELCLSSAFKEGFLGIVIDAPRHDHGADLAVEQRTTIASKSVENAYSSINKQQISFELNGKGLIETLLVDTQKGRMPRSVSSSIQKPIRRHNRPFVECLPFGTVCACTLQDFELLSNLYKNCQDYLTFLSPIDKIAIVDTITYQLALDQQFQINLSLASDDRLYIRFESQMKTLQEIGCQLLPVSNMKGKIVLGAQRHGALASDHRALVLIGNLRILADCVQSKLVSLETQWWISLDCHPEKTQQMLWKLMKEKRYFSDKQWEKLKTFSYSHFSTLGVGQWLNDKVMNHLIEKWAS
ncbi:hypothetical protein D9757_002991 [Collybiopsis confluens]|uniref:Eukaryotic translation initiation factor 4G1 eIF4E-binding domain-containing protein n=1 Tax=Collybiopsis confluens TaxID=2823264 RepID=A0A8H5HXB5_9AGAR|nr:hypothetical protein D9757_002991 [Collybiopsis confluens]